jgi:hypothetical protein
MLAFGETVTPKGPYDEQATAVVGVLALTGIPGVPIGDDARVATALALILRSPKLGIERPNTAST